MSPENVVTVDADVWKLCRIGDKQKYNMPLHPSVPCAAYSQASDVSKW